MPRILPPVADTEGVVESVRLGDGERRENGRICALNWVEGCFCSFVEARNTAWPDNAIFVENDTGAGKSLNCQIGAIAGQTSNEGVMTTRELPRTSALDASLPQDYKI